MLAGQVEYEAGLKLQAKARQQVVAGELDGVFIVLEHRPVITIGRAGGAENLVFNKEALAMQNVELVYTDRGGNITCHNPGQLVCYPILNLGKWRQDVHWYVQTLEEVLIRVLSRFGLRAGRKAKYTGVWLENEKIAAIGVAVRRWITRHGFALNVNNALDLFQGIVPCGIREFGVTSLARRGVTAKVEHVTMLLAEELAAVFQCELVSKYVRGDR